MYLCLFEKSSECVQAHINFTVQIITEEYVKANNR